MVPGLQQLVGRVLQQLPQEPLRLLPAQMQQLVRSQVQGRLCPLSRPTLTTLSCTASTFPTTLR